MILEAASRLKKADWLSPESKSRRCKMENLILLIGLFVFCCLGPMILIGTGLVIGLLISNRKKQTIPPAVKPTASIPFRHVIDCPKCGQENIVEWGGKAVACKRCGAALPRRCSKGHQVRANAKFCPRCNEKLQ